MKTKLKVSDLTKIKRLKLTDTDVSFYFFCFLALFPYFEPRLFFNYAPLHIIDTCYLLAQMASFCILALAYVFQQRFSYCLLLLALYRIVVFISTMKSAGEIDNGWFGKTLIILGTTMALELFMRKDALKTMKCLYAILAVPLGINFFMCLLGIKIASSGTHYYLIGMRTQFTNSMIPAILLSIMISYLETNKLWTKIPLLTIFICIVQLLKEWVGTGLVIIALLLGIIYFFSTHPQNFNALIAFASSIILDFLIVFVRIQNIFSFIIVDMLHKDLTLTGRTPIWDYAIRMFKKSPLYGYGELGNGGFVTTYWADRPVPAHNTILQVLHDGGILSLIFLLLVFLYTTIVLVKNKENILSCILAAGIFTIGIEMIMEVLQYQIYFYLIAIIACNIKYFYPKSSDLSSSHNKAKLMQELVTSYT